MTVSANEEQMLCKAIEIARIKGVLPEATKQELAKVFGSRFKNALEAIEKGKVRRIVFMPSRREIWLVSGKERSYLILENAGYCSCEDFYFRVISHEEFLCYHLLAQRLAKVLGCYESVEEVDVGYYEIAVKTAREGEKPRKLSIRDVESIRKVIAAILYEEKRLPLEKLLETVHEAGFPSLTKKHLIVILVTDKAKRFRSVEGNWRLGTDFEL